LYLKCNSVADPRFRVEGRDVYESVPVAPWEATLGATIEVPTPSGNVQVKVPPLPGRPQAAPERARHSRNPPGDLYLVLEVVLRRATRTRREQIYETMARDLAFNPRQKLGV